MDSISQKTKEHHYLSGFFFLYTRHCMVCLTREFKMSINLALLLLSSPCIKDEDFEVPKERLGITAPVNVSLPPYGAED